MLVREERGNLRVLRLDHGPANALDLELLEALESAIAELEPGSAAVLTGTDRFFSAGVDLHRLLEGGSDYLEVYFSKLLSCLETLFFAEVPIVASVNGHAIAGGCIVACGCDLRIMADTDLKIGVTELKVGLPFPTIALEMLGAVLAPHAVQDLVLTARLLEPAEAYRLGLVERVVPFDSCLDAALEQLDRLAEVPHATYALNKRQLRQPVRERLRKSSEVDQVVYERWASAKARAQIEAFVEATHGKDTR